VASVELDRVSKTFPGAPGGPVSAVRDLSLAARDGELLALVGPSGCGKTTTLRLIAGLETCETGTIRIGGRVVNGLAPQERDVAMVFQNHALYPHMTVRENLAFGLTLRRTPKAEIERRIGEAARTLGLEALLARRPRELSGGERQRAAVGRALVRQPQAFLFDEPLSHLDGPLRAQLRLELAQLHRRLGVTMLYVTHDQVEAMTLGQRIAVIKDGRLQQVGEPLSVYGRPANLFVAGFIGSPPMNLFPGKLARGEGGWRFLPETRAEATAPANPGWPLPAAWAPALAPWLEQRLVLGLRPEHVGAGPLDGAVVEGRVGLVEAMGAETLVHVETAQVSLVARRPPSERHAPGDGVRLPLDLAQARLFDTVTGQAIETGGTG
jgi:multiple sugar transport system ATP-binding protein